MSILEALSQQLGEDRIAQISRQIGADPQATASAIQMALPTVLGGLANNAAQPDGAQSLDRALDRDHDGSLLDDPGALLGAMSGATGGGAKATDGAGILGHIFGGRRDVVQQGLGRASGLSGQQMTQLLMILAPIVMSYLGRMKRQQGMDAGGLGGALQQERQQMEERSPGIGGILGDLLGGGGADRPGIADDIARMAPNVLGGLFGKR